MWKVKLFLSDLKAYGWWFEDGGQLYLNIAFTANSVDKLISILNNFNTGQKLTISLKKIDKSMPHHLDNENEIYPEKFELLKYIEILVSENAVKPVLILENENISMEIGKQLIPYFLTSLEESKEQGYLLENYLDVEILSDINGNSFGDKLYIWSCDNDKIIFY